jgi:non-specific serine/threonine protein kinase
MLETIHEFAWEKLQKCGEAEDLSRQHAVYYLALAEEAETHLRGPQQPAWLEHLEWEHNNLRVALRWALGRGDLETASRLAGSLWTFWERHCHLTEGRQWLSEALEKSARAPLRVPPAVRAKALAGAGFLAGLQGDYAAARALEEESLAAYRTLGDKQGIAQSFNFLADIDYVMGDLERAAPRFEQALSLWREAGTPWGIGKALSDLGEVARTKGDYVTAQSRYREALAIFRETGDSIYTAISLHNLGHVAHRLGEYSRAGACFTEGLLIGNDMGNTHLSAWCLLGVAGVAASERQPELSARLLGAAQVMLQSVGGSLDPVDRAEYELNMAAARAQLGQEDFEKAWAEGQAMTAEQMVNYAQTLSVEEAAASSSQTPSPASTTRLRLEGLTRREQDVAVLIAEGKSNRQIADELVVSERTVEGHVSNILSKLGFRSRARISAWVIERGQSAHPD